MNKYDVLKAMHTIVQAMNDDSAYYDWIYVVPDEASEEDLHDIADDLELFNDSVKCFKNIFSRYVIDEDCGLYVGEQVFPLSKPIEDIENSMNESDEISL